MCDCIFVTLQCGILGQVWYLIVSIPDLCHLTYFYWDDQLREEAEKESTLERCDHDSFHIGSSQPVWDTANSKRVLLDFSLTVKAATLIFISGCGWAITSAKEGKSGFIYNLVKS